MHRKPARPASLPKPSPPIPVLLDRALVGALAALVVARPLAAGDDPGRLRLTSGTGAISFNLCAFLVLFGAVLWRAAYGRGRPVRWAIVPLLIAGVGVTAFVSSQLGDRYARPGLFVAWEWGAIAAGVFLTRWLVPSASDSRGLLNVLLATAVSAAGLAVYQAVGERLDLPTMDVVVPSDSTALAGDDEFYPQLNRQPAAPSGPRGTLDSAETLLIFLFLVLPAAMATYRARRASRWGRWPIAVPGVLVAAAVAVLLARPFDPPPASWRAAANLIAEHPFLGVGPGNISRFAPDALTPHSAWLGLAATTGLFGLALFGLAVAVSFRAALRPTAPGPIEPPAAGPRWEFYLGGVVGLLLGFLWTFGETPAEAPAGEVFKLGAAAVFRAILWFTAFALLETIRPAARDLGRAALVGVAFTLAFALFSDAPGKPTVLFPLGVMLALAINFRRSPEPEGPPGPWTRPVLVTGTIASAILAVAYLVTAAVPAWATAGSVRQARMASRHYPELVRKIDAARPGAERANAVTAARNYLVADIVNPLVDAARRDPTNAALLLELAHWRRPLWDHERVLNPENAARVADETRKLAERASELDPHNLAGKRSLFEALLLYRRQSTAKQPERIAALNKLIGQIAEREPGEEVPLRLRVVRMLLDRGDLEGLEAEVTTLLGLNRVVGSPHGRLTDEQKADVIRRAKQVMPKASKEVVEDWER
jgi:hypothetical protein